MNEEMRKKLQDAISSCAEASQEAQSALEAMQYAQAACNLSNVIIGLTVMDKKN